jgi:hypothetical protein
MGSSTKLPSGSPWGAPTPNVPQQTAPKPKNPGKQRKMGPMGKMGVGAVKGAVLGGVAGAIKPAKKPNNPNPRRPY